MSLFMSLLLETVDIEIFAYVNRSSFPHARGDCAYKLKKEHEKHALSYV